MFQKQLLAILAFATFLGSPTQSWAGNSPCRVYVRNDGAGVAVFVDQVLLGEYYPNSPGHRGFVESVISQSVRSFVSSGACSGYVLIQPQEWPYNQVRTLAFGGLPKDANVRNFPELSGNCGPK